MKQYLLLLLNIIFINCAYSQTLASQTNCGSGASANPTSCSVVLPQVSSISSASASYGALSIGLDAKATDGPQGPGSAQISGYATASFRDVFTVTGPGLNGLSGVFRAELAVPYEYFVTMEPNTDYTLLDMYVDFGLCIGGTCRDNGVISSMIILGAFDRTSLIPIVPVERDFSNNAVQDGVLQLDVPIIFGQPFSLRARIISSVNALSVTEGVIAQASFLGLTGAYWAGISSIEVNDMLDFNRADFIVTSASGTNYIQSFVPSIPEPSTLLTFGMGTIFLLFATVSRRVSTK